MNQTKNIMQKPKLIYVFDTYCSWCYGFDPVLIDIHQKYTEELDFEVISGGMIPEDTPVQKMAERFPDPEASYERVAQTTGQRVSEQFIEMLRDPQKYDYTFNSVYPARALGTLKHFAPGRAVDQAKALQDLVFGQALDLTKTDSYKPIAEQFGVQWEAFVHRFESDTSLEEARYDFHLARQLKVTSYPAVLIQTGDQYFYLVARGFTPFEDLDKRIQNVFEEDRNKKDQPA